ncbi:DUF3375 domain-containing protein [Prevotella sp. P3-122]|uniref:DUF3375 domain-containing protein n=1 Tax=Prevotella sp. P3-122 TaxID=2024223 RepID=UPI000B9634B6|nr:DUF3375 domain-containing protein [Prevotella sp. P3-122]MDO4957831.1 DUF3375 domain-containing protein [Prevotellaceae bacterium]OYP58898.1 hypothetical protein CIL02_13115 [Prevotella sp. P3-122]
MDYSQLIQTLNSSPSVRLLKMRSAEFFLVFVKSVFDEERAVGQEKLLMLLENQLDNQELLEEDASMERLVESNDVKAKRLIKDWTDRGFLTNYQNEEGEIIYELSSHSNKVIDWIESLKKEDYIGTESKFKTLFSQLKELVEYSNEDREKRIELLRQRKEEIERQIERLEMGEEVEVYEDYQIEPRFNSLNKMAKELLSDFKEVDDNFKDIIKQIYQRQTDNEQKKDLLSYIFDAYAELKNSQQGKSFYAFWEFLLSAELQKEWDELTDTLYKTLEDRQIEAKDMFLKEIKRHLFDAGEKVSKTNDRMSEKLSLIIRQNERSNVEATKQIIKDIKKLLIEVSKNKEKSDASLRYETIEINLPIERQLTFTPTREVEYMDKPQDSVIGINDLERIGKLYNPYYVDRKILRKRIDEMLKDNGQTTIAEVIANNSGIEKGLSELFGYIGILKEYKTAVSTEHTQYITFSEDKSIEIPEIIITR